MCEIAKWRAAFHQLNQVAYRRAHARIIKLDLGVASLQIVIMLDAGGDSWPFLEGAVELKPGDWVRTESGEVGKIVHITRLTVFVDVRVAGKENRITAFLQSQLKKIPPPEHDDEKR